MTGKPSSGSQEKNKGKPRSIKQEVAAYKKRMRIISAVTMSVVLCLVVIVSSFYAEGFFASPSDPTGQITRASGNVDCNGTPHVSLRAALIDTLSNDSGAGGFVDSVNRTLRNAGYGLDVFEGSQVTVDFLKRFAEGYKLVILRMHSALSSDTSQLYLFTGQLYSAGEYLAEQSSHMVAKGVVDGSSQIVFSVNWAFVEKFMAGKFNGSLVVAMGCDGANDPAIVAELKVQGDAGYVGWTGSVVLSHSDEAVSHLVGDLFAQKLSPKDAVSDTNDYVGPDPATGSILECYVS